jgi:hypothetical protein
MVGGEQNQTQNAFIFLGEIYHKKLDKNNLTYSHYHTILYNMNEWIIVAIILIVTGCIWVWSELMKK